MTNDDLKRLTALFYDMYVQTSGLVGRPDQTGVGYRTMIIDHLRRIESILKVTVQDSQYQEELDLGPWAPERKV